MNNPSTFSAISTGLGGQFESVPGNDRGSPHLADLNPSQLEAVLHAEGPLLIFAAAGSGKTRVLTRRIAHLILEHHVHPQRIFAVTFTNKAAGEMRERVGKAVYPTASVVPMWVSTFHSGCARILRQHAKLLDYTSNFAIYDTSDSQALMKRVYQKLKIDPKTIDPRYVSNRIDKAKNNYLFADAIRDDKFLPSETAHLVADIYEEYQKELQRCNAMDFGDLLCNVLTLFHLEPQVLARYQDQFLHLLIDEYQDTNRVQYLLIQILAAKHRNIAVVGDDDQSIYAFRGATVENILNFQKDFPDTKIVTLDTNYRSSGNILQAANTVIAQNTRRQKKTMRTDNGDGEKITLYHGFDEQEEARFISQQIAQAFQDGVRPKEIAIFYRTNAQSRAIEDALRESGIAYEIYGGFKFYDRKEIKDLLSYLRLLINDRDNEAFLRVINVPARGLGPTSVGALLSYASKNQISLLNALNQALQTNAPFLTTANRKKFVVFFELISGLSKEAAVVEESLQAPETEISRHEKVYLLSQLLKNIAEKSGYVAELKAQDSVEAESRMENIQELYVVAAEFTKRALENAAGHAASSASTGANEKVTETSAGSGMTLRDFLERTSLSSDLDKEENLGKQVAGDDADKAEGLAGEAEGKEKKKPVETVSLMTLHLAKGLEFEMVFLTGLEEGILPHMRSLDDRNELEEERRLAYVGITRARRRLYLSYARYRDSFGRSYMGVGGMSRFIEDVPRSVIEDRGDSGRRY